MLRLERYYRKGSPCVAHSAICSVARARPSTAATFLRKAENPARVAALLLPIFALGDGIPSIALPVSIDRFSPGYSLTDCLASLDGSPLAILFPCFASRVNV